jgi:proline iminopeptidase
MTNTRPDLFSAYVGTGQIVNEREDEGLGYAALLAESRSRQDRHAIRQLETIGPPPWDSQSSYGVLTRQALAY